MRHILVLCFSTAVDGAVVLCCGLCACPLNARCELMNVAEVGKKRRKTSVKMAEGTTSLKGLRAQMGRNSPITSVFAAFAV